MLRDDVAGIDAIRKFVQRDSCFAIVVVVRPEQRIRSAMAWQQRRMQIDRTETCTLDHTLRNDVRERRDDEKIGVEIRSIVKIDRTVRPFSAAARNDDVRD